MVSPALSFRTDDIDAYMSVLERRWQSYGHRPVVLDAFWSRGPVGGHPNEVMAWLDVAFSHAVMRRAPHIPLDDCIEATLNA